MKNDIVYNKSNAIEKYKIRISQTSKRLFVSLQNDNNLNSDKVQRLADSLCKDFKCLSVNVFFGGRQPNSTNERGKLKSKTLGNYASVLRQIKVFKYTAKQNKIVASKTAINTFIHEFVHHLDYYHSKLGGSLHTRGFYMRISWLTENLK